MDEAREEAVWELNLARVHNKAIQSARILVDQFLDTDEDEMSSLAKEIDKLSIPLRPQEVEDLYRRRYVLLDKDSLTESEEQESKSIREKLDKLVTGRDLQDQEGIDMMRKAVRLLKKHEIPGFESALKKAEGEDV